MCYQLSQLRPSKLLGWPRWRQCSTTTGNALTLGWQVVLKCLHTRLASLTHKSLWLLLIILPLKRVEEQLIWSLTCRILVCLPFLLSWFFFHSVEFAILETLFHLLMVRLWALGTAILAASLSVDHFCMWIGSFSPRNFLVIWNTLIVVDEVGSLLTIAWRMKSGQLFLTYWSVYKCW